MTVGPCGSCPSPWLTNITDSLCYISLYDFTPYATLMGAMTTGFTHIWYMGSVTAANIIANPTAVNITNSGIYYLVCVETATGCADTASFTVNLKGCGSVGDRIFVDADGDGIWDVGEGISGVVVKVTYIDPITGLPVTVTVTTGADGYYNVSGLPLGVNYTMTIVSVPSGYTVSGARTISGTITGTSTTNLTLDLTICNLMVTYTTECPANNAPGTITATFTGGTAPFSWNGFGTNNATTSGRVISITPSQTVVSDTIRVTDANGCMAKVYAEINCVKQPVTWLSFSGNSIKEGNNLLWRTASEFNNDRFVIERSINGGRSFVEVGVVVGNGTTTVIHSYEFLDKYTTSGVVYYRLKQIDFNGQYAYSNTITIARGKKFFGLISIAPIPAVTQLNVNYMTNIDGLMNVRVYDVVGRLVLHSECSAVVGENTLHLDIAQLPNALYLIQLSDGETVVTDKFVKE